MLNSRADLAIQIGKQKSKSNSCVFVPSREVEIYNRLIRMNGGPLPDESVLSVFREILSSTRFVEKSLSVAYLGPEGTFSYLASKEIFGSRADYLSLESIDQVFLEVKKENSDYGVVPVENSLEGMVTRTLDLFVDSTLKIYAEKMMPIHHSLVSRSGNLKKIKTLYTFYQPLAQCRSWVDRNLANAKIIEVASSAEAAKRASKNPNSGGISNPEAAWRNKLKIVAKKIEDYPNNYTRFLVISPNASKPSKWDKTSVIFSIPHEAGSLYSTLKPLSDNGINLTKIESRPVKREAWEYLFYIDFQGHMDDPKIGRVLNKFKKSTVFFKILGSYPVGL